MNERWEVEWKLHIGMPMFKDCSKPHSSKTNFSSHLLMKIGLQIFCLVELVSAPFQSCKK